MRASSHGAHGAALANSDMFSDRLLVVRVPATLHLIEKCKGSVHELSELSP